LVYDETYTVLRQNKTALCLSETDKQTPPEVLTTISLRPSAPRRLHSEANRPGRNASTLGSAKAWMCTLFKHEDAGKAPAYARSFSKAALIAVSIALAKTGGSGRACSGIGVGRVQLCDP